LSGAVIQALIIQLLVELTPSSRCATCKQPRRIEREVHRHPDTGQHGRDARRQTRHLMFDASASSGNATLLRLF
jgi:hypothetical protein